jgi:hypothetical protein
MSLKKRMLAEGNIAAIFSLQPSLPSVSGSADYTKMSPALQQTLEQTLDYRE